MDGTVKEGVRGPESALYSLAGRMEWRHICLAKWMEASTASSTSSGLATHPGSHIREQGVSLGMDTG